MNTSKNEQKKFSPYRDYREEFGRDLVNEATRLGNPASYIQAKFGLDDKTFSCWLGNAYEGRYLQPHFVKCYNEYLQKRRDFLDNLALSCKINEKVYSCFVWSQLSQKVNPPKEITCNADVKTTMQVDDLNEIITRLENKKSATGF